MVDQSLCNSHKYFRIWLCLFQAVNSNANSHSVVIGTTSFFPETFPFRSMSNPSKIPSNLPGMVWIGQALSFPLSISFWSSAYHDRAQTPISGRGGMPYGSGSSTPRPEMAPPMTSSCLIVFREQRLPWYCSSAQYLPPVRPMAA